MNERATGVNLQGAKEGKVDQFKYEPTKEEEF